MSPSGSIRAPNDAGACRHHGCVSEGSDSRPARLRMRVRRTLRTSLALAVLALAASLIVTCSPGYVIRAGLAESRILSRRRPIADVIADPRTPEPERARLRLVTEARDYAHHVLDLDVGDSYTTYSWVDRDTLLLVVSAAYKDRFEPRTWWFPIVGRVPYKGFFDFDAAHREARSLEREGFDTYVRPSPAFSTLGFFNDPLLNTALRTTDVGLTSTVIHELLHNTLFVPSRISFNESFASFVGDRGAIDFLCAREGDDSGPCHDARNEWDDNLTFGSFLGGLIADLEQLYARTDLDSAAKIERREQVFDDARRHFEADVEPRLHRAFRGFARRPLNNATLIGIRLYYDRLDLFEEAYQRSDRDLLSTIALIRDAVRGDDTDPFTAVRRRVDSLPVRTPS